MAGYANPKYRCVPLSCQYPGIVLVVCEGVTIVESPLPQGILCPFQEF